MLSNCWAEMQEKTGSIKCSDGGSRYQIKRPFFKNGLLIIQVMMSLFLSAVLPALFVVDPGTVSISFRTS
jgi:hypothetical protein